ncbi:hypothetical protein [Streptomyces sp. NPDC047985]|uniref:hypothetical protein n=1 Tax=unclassified Streptomyces TaxID=2593676 RepID=UPI0034258E68
MPERLLRLLLTRLLLTRLLLLLTRLLLTRMLLLLTRLLGHVAPPPRPTACRRVASLYQPTGADSRL